MLDCTRLLEKITHAKYRSVVSDIEPAAGTKRIEEDSRGSTYSAQGAGAGDTVAVRPSFVPVRKSASNCARLML